MSVVFFSVQGVGVCSGVVVVRGYIYNIKSRKLELEVFIVIDSYIIIRSPSIMWCVGVDFIIIIASPGFVYGGVDNIGNSGFGVWVLP